VFRRTIRWSLLVRQVRLVDVARYTYSHGRFSIQSCRLDQRWHLLRGRAVIIHLHSYVCLTVAEDDHRQLDS